ncbi:hypothetical protein THOM_1631 [Trachipleistophora hominis]|uniref:Uncharacterized protein n=1 Tax=Trachipleistophora hominis TaxID=72359 RepID=L7JXF9_TRAHO|nr:hypothetical protein THOM_1631 [Trachipleistophora hominis]
MQMLPKEDMNQLVKIIEEGGEVPINVSINELSKDGEVYSIDLLSCTNIKDNRKIEFKMIETDEITAIDNNIVFEDFIKVIYIDDYVERIKGDDGCFTGWFKTN